MNILILGGGGREHALVWKIKQSPQVKNIYCIPGNAGIEDMAECHNLSLNDFPALTDFAKKFEIDLTIVGPEQPLVNGIVDYFETNKLAVFGPRRQAAQLEGSKVFSKNFMKRHKIPSSEYAVFSHPDLAFDYMKQLPEGRIVIKADGLAAGKGSIVCANKTEAANAVEVILVKQIFKEAGRQIVIEEFIEGEEASLFVICDGKDYQVLSPAQDFKRALDGDGGKNTGGMGSYAPTPFLSPQNYQRALSEIVEPVLRGLESENIIYKGVLYCGLMLTSAGPKVVEFNCRFGDPETQVVLPLLETDLVEILQSAVQGNIAQQNIKLKQQHAVCVIAASGGYPDVYEKGKVIKGLEHLGDNELVFHAGTIRIDGQILTNGGRVLGVTGVAADLKTAVQKAYNTLSKIHFEKMHYRKDIAAKAL
jgi:phosphoribosylamine--glycine ligase